MHSKRDQRSKEKKRKKKFKDYLWGFKGFSQGNYSKGVKIFPFFVRKGSLKLFLRWPFLSHFVRGRGRRVIFQDKFLGLEAFGDCISV